jgi:hypothetical protein
MLAPQSQEIQTIAPPSPASTSPQQFVALAASLRPAVNLGVKRST